MSGLLGIDIFRMSYRRAKMAAMTMEPINAALWSLAGFDPALVHFAELREHFQKLDQEVAWSIDRVLSNYIDWQCNSLRHTQQASVADVDALITARLGEDDVSRTLMHASAVTEDPLVVELVTYGMYLALLTPHGNAPWNRLRDVIAECFAQKHAARKVSA